MHLVGHHDVDAAHGAEAADQIEIRRPQPARIRRPVGHRDDNVIERDGRLPIEMKELVRIQIAGVYDCDYCAGFITPQSQARGLTFDKVRWVMTPDDPAAPFTPAERAMLRYTLAMATGSGALTEADVAAIRAHFRNDQIVELSMLAAGLIGFGRVSITGLKLVE